MNLLKNNDCYHNNKIIISNLMGLVMDSRETNRFIYILNTISDYLTLYSTYWWWAMHLHKKDAVSHGPYCLDFHHATMSERDFNLKSIHHMQCTPRNQCFKHVLVRVSIFVQCTITTLLMSTTILISILNCGT